MDLVAGVRKEGSRGGRGDFKWSDVKESSHRENYLGHSLMAPVGRWQQGRDLNWYAKGKDESTEDSAERAKRELDDERRRVKEAEQEALARALGLPVAPKSSNANLTPLGGSEVRRAVQGTAESDEEAEGGRGIGFGSYGGHAMEGAEGEVLAPVGLDSDTRHRDRSPRDSRSRHDRSKDRDRRRDHHRERHHRRAQDRGDHGRRREGDREKDRERVYRDDNHDGSERRSHRRHDRRRPSKSRSRSPRREKSRREREDARERDSYVERRHETNRSRHRRPSSPRSHSIDHLDKPNERRLSDHYSPSDHYRPSRRGDDSYTPEVPRERRRHDIEETRDRDRGRSHREHRT